MDNDFYTDKIEAYLLNKLDLEDKIAFRQVFEKDPILKSELQFQEQIIEAIQTNRKMELKARLDAIQIPQSSLQQAPRFAWLMGATVLVGVLLLAVFMQYNPLDNKVQNQPVSQEAQANADENQLTTTKDTSENSEKPVNQAKIDIKIAQNAELIPTDINTQPSSVVVTPFTTNDAVEDVLDQNNISSNSPKTDITLAMDRPYLLDTKVDKPKRFMSKIDNILDAQKNTYAFDMEDEGDVKGIFDGTNEVNLEEIAQRNTLSYQYYNGQLFLYNYHGSYKIIRTDMDNVEKHFLYYDGRFYELKTPQIEKRELSLIKDQNLIEHLQQLVVKLYGK